MRMIWYPLSPYLFIISMEFLTNAMDKKLQANRIKEIRVAATSPVLTHAIYADDLIIFAKSDAHEVNHLKQIP
jgi:hypothetical protein